MSLDTLLTSRINSAKKQLEKAVAEYSPVTFANSFGSEDMVLTDLIAKHAPDIEIFSLDTGRLPAETYDLMQKVKERYDIEVKTYFPDYRSVEAYIRDHGPNAFYESVELRKRCCFIRKVEPLKRALAGKKAWLTGLRREQAPTREQLPFSERDGDHGLQKFNPLADWTLDNVWNYIRQFNVPYNALHDKHYPSIGCAPCTRAIAAGEDIRAGRWWWENPETKECGLHPAKRAANK